MAIRLLADISTFSHHKCTVVHRAKNQYLYLGDFCKTVCVRRASPNSYHSVVYINYEYLYYILKQQAKNIESLAKKYSVDVCINSMGSLFTIFFIDVDKVENLEDSLKSNTENFSIYFNTMLENGIIVPPSQFEAHFLSMAHTKKELNRTLEVIEMAFKKIGEKSGK